MELNQRQRTFADYYIESGNITESAIRAGYSKNYANAQGYKLLENVGIKAYIDGRMKEISSTRIADQKEVMEFLTSLMRGEIKDSMSILDGNGVQKVVNVTAPSQARKSAAELIGKRYALWTDKKELSGTLGVNIIDDLDEDDE